MVRNRQTSVPEGAVSGPWSSTADGPQGGVLSRSSIRAIPARSHQVPIGGIHAAGERADTLSCCHQIISCRLQPVSLFCTGNHALLWYLQHGDRAHILNQVHTLEWGTIDYGHAPNLHEASTSCCGA